MVNSINVQGDILTLKSLINIYKSLDDNINTYWKGDSFKNFEIISDEFISSYLNILYEQLVFYLDAVKMYENYSTSEEKLEVYSKNKNNSISDYEAGLKNAKKDIDKYSELINKYTYETKNYKNKINLYLNLVNKKKFDVDSLSYDVKCLSSMTFPKLDIISSSSSGTGGSIPGNVISSTEIPSSIKQGPYTVTCYGVEGWWLGGTSVASIASGSSQESVHNIWVQNGAKYKNGIAVINQDGVDYYLIATSETLGSVGDKVKVNFDDGSSIPCIIADSKSPGDGNYTDYGHSYGDSVNILEFEVDKDYYLSRGNPSTDSYGLDWNSNSNVTRVDDYGSII